MENNKLCILGSTGSIGTQALEVASHTGMTVDGICADSNITLLEQQIRKYKPAFCAVKNRDAAKELKIAVADTSVKIIDGQDSPCILAQETAAGTVVNSIIGLAGLLPTLSAIDAGKNLAIANKETLVAAGSIVMSRVKEKGIRLLPIDSEHCAIHQCIGKNDKSEISKLILTASGGPFFGKDREYVNSATIEMALKHPNWSMGRKITIDSASLVNKGLELIEAMWLFDMPEDKIDVVVHRESIIHSMVEYKDSSVMAQLAVPDMRLCIQYALLGTAKCDGLTPKLDFSSLRSLSFYAPDNDVFPSISMARKAARTGGTMPCIFNSSNEACVDLFLGRKIAFGDIFTLIQKAMDNVAPKFGKLTLDDILEADRLSREFVYKSAENGNFNK